jgi:hypothetical protein
MRRILVTVLLPILLLILAACSGESRPAPSTPTGPTVHHEVFFALKDPAEADALIRACDDIARLLPGIVAWHAGRPLEIGRPEVTKDYHVAYTTTFASEAAYRAYLDDPRHVAVRDAWIPKIAAISIRDFTDATP